MTTNVQEVFDKVIEAGHYREFFGDSSVSSCLMCFALNKAFIAGLIDSDETRLGRLEIKEYLRGFGSLGGLLANKDHAYDFETRLAIYKDWANRPTFGEAK